MINKHAYLIMAHNDFYVLEKLLLLLDDKRNDFYLHIDKKSKDFEVEKFKSLPLESRIFFIDRMDVRWGDFSQTVTELCLLKAASNNKYMYYHLISGVDLPLKTNDYIHEFFQNNNGKEFVHISNEEEAMSVKWRVLSYHFMRLRSSKNTIVSFIGKMFGVGCKIIFIILHLQRKWDISKSLAYGSQWFSITHECVEYILSMEQWIKHYFKYTSCSDELFIQTLLYNSEFKEKLYLSNSKHTFSCNARMIDWKRGNPYVWRKEDCEELLNSDKIFARKFSSVQDKEIIDYIFESIK